MRLINLRLYYIKYICWRSDHSSPVKKSSKKRKIVIDDDLDVDEEGTHKADDSFDIASLHDDSDDDDVCKVMPVAFFVAFNDKYSYCCSYDTIQ